MFQFLSRKTKMKRLPSKPHDHQITERQAEEENRASNKAPHSGLIGFFFFIQTTISVPSGNPPDNNGKIQQKPHQIREMVETQVGLYTRMDRIGAMRKIIQSSILNHKITNIADEKDEIEKDVNDEGDHEKSDYLVPEFGLRFRFHIILLFPYLFHCQPPQIMVIRTLDLANPSKSFQQITPLLTLHKLPHLIRNGFFYHRNFFGRLFDFFLPLLF